MQKAEKVLLAIVVSMLFASTALASFFYGPYKTWLFPEWKASHEAPFTGALVVEISDGTATAAHAVTGKSFAPYECGETGQLCPDVKELLQGLGSAAFVVDGDKLVVTAETP